MGDVIWKDEVWPGIHTPLVPREQWERVQDVLEGRYQNQRSKERKNDFAFTGLIQCAHCGCALSAQLQKEQYIYYRCTSFKGDCGEPYTREELLEAQFAQALDRLTFPDATMALLQETLKQSHEDQARYHQEAIQRLEAECAKLQRRIDQAYVDKLDGLITEDFFRRKSSEWRSQQRNARSTIAKHEDANQAYMDEALMLLGLGQHAARLFSAQDATGKRKLLNFMVSNSTWGDGLLDVEWKQPYDILEEINRTPEHEPPAEETSTGVLSRKVTPTGFEPVLPG
ncbi:MAG: recombinase zinc beta ribbon domain-containing protein [Alphaproteobacteria bacterium]|nr:recombinase zinc beta ribbon domain-containing protein [Alphaproteobacteria bacterium]